MIDPTDKGYKTDPHARGIHALEAAMKVVFMGPQALGSKEQAEQILIDLQIFKAQTDSNLDDKQVAFLQSIIERTEGPKAELLSEMLRHAGACKRILATLKQEN